MRPVHRRAFVLTALAPLAGCAAPSLATRARPRRQTGLVVRAGQDRTGTPRTVFGGQRIDAKALPADADGDLYVIEHTDDVRGGPSRHVHHAQDEWFYVLSGDYRIEVGEDAFEVAPGDSVFAPRGVPHVWAHTSDGPGRLLIVFQPAGQMESFLLALSQMGRVPDPAAVARLSAAHGMMVVGPPLPV